MSESSHTLKVPCTCDFGLPLLDTRLEANLDHALNEDCDICQEVPAKDVGTLVHACGRGLCRDCFTGMMNSGCPVSTTKCPSCRKPMVRELTKKEQELHNLHHVKKQIASRKTASKYKVVLNTSHMIRTVWRNLPAGSSPSTFRKNADIHTSVRREIDVVQQNLEFFQGTATGAYISLEDLLKDIPKMNLSKDDVLALLILNRTAGTSLFHLVQIPESDIRFIMPTRTAFVILRNLESLPWKHYQSLMKSGSPLAPLTLKTRSLRLLYRSLSNQPLDDLELDLSRADSDPSAHYVLLSTHNRIYAVPHTTSGQSGELAKANKLNWTVTSQVLKATDFGLSQEPLERDLSNLLYGLSNELYGRGLPPQLQTMLHGIFPGADPSLQLEMVEYYGLELGDALSRSVEIAYARRPQQLNQRPLVRPPIATGADAGGVANLIARFSGGSRLPH